MILPEHTKVYVYKKPIDMRKSYDGLYNLVRQQNVFDGGLFLFVSKNRKRAKCLFWDGSGLLILMKRMEYGRFADIWKRDSISYEELGEFLKGSKTIERSSYNSLTEQAMNACKKIEDAAYNFA